MKYTVIFKDGSNVCLDVSNRFEALKYAANYARHNLKRGNRSIVRCFKSK